MKQMSITSKWVATIVGIFLFACSLVFTTAVASANAQLNKRVEYVEKNADTIVEILVELGKINVRMDSLMQNQLMQIENQKAMRKLIDEVMDMVR